MTLPYGALAANRAGVNFVRHKVITCNGTWGQGLVQYPSDVINGLALYRNDSLCEEVVNPYPASFGPVGGNPSSPSYKQSLQQGYEWTGNWLNDGKTPDQTWGIIGYSQGGELAAMVQMALAPGGDFAAHAPTFIGGITFGNPRRKAGAVAPGIGNPGANWRGIASVQMPNLPVINGQTVWADYVHSTANGDAGDDMYTMVPTGPVGQIMSDVYTTATEAQINDGTVFLQDMVSSLEQLVSDSGLLKGLTGGLPSLIAMGEGAIIGFLTDIIGIGNLTTATGVDADVAAAVLGLKFLTASGGPTGPHISYLGEIAGYSNLVAYAVDFLYDIATLTPAQM